MKKLLPVFLCFQFGLLNTLLAQGPNWQWAQGYGSNYDQSNAITTDSYGNIYTLGTFGDVAISIGNAYIKNTGNPSQNIFIVKYDSLGNVLWARNGGQDSGEYRIGAGSFYASGTYAYSISTDADGNVYATGSFNGPAITFGHTTYLKPGPPTEDYSFIVKYNSSGDLLWLQGLGPAEAPLMTADASGNTYITGNFEDSTLTFGNTVLVRPGTPPNSSAVFVVKLDPSGNVLWAQAAGGILFDFATAITGSPSGNVFIAGAFYSPSITWGNSTLYNHAPQGQSSIFLVQLDPSGTVVQARAIGKNSDRVKALNTDPDGDLYMVGDMYSDTLVFGNTTLASAGHSDIFMVKYDASGNVLWANSIGGKGYDYGTGISTDAAGNTYITGWAQNTVYIGNTLLDHADGNFNFVAKYDSQANPQWAKSIPGLLDQSAFCADAGGNVCLTGVFNGPAATFYPFTLVSAGYSVYTGRLSNDSSVTNPTEPIVVYPNPSTGDLFFRGTVLGDKLDIFDILGRKIYSTITTNDNSYINMTGAPSGTYIYRITKASSIVLKGRFILLTKPTPVYIELGDGEF